jgi:ElaB/YqjD/DUF883 family membrane-anchored ribosome-binding protein
MKIIPRIALTVFSVALLTTACGKKKDTGDKVEDAIKSAGDKVGDAADKAVDKTEGAIDKVKDKVEDKK